MLYLIYQWQGCLSNETRGVHKITQIGIDIILSNVDRISTQYLKNLNPEFKARIEGHYKNRTAKVNESSKDLDLKEETLNPEERLFEAERD